MKLFLLLVTILGTVSISCNVLNPKKKKKKEVVSVSPDCDPQKQVCERHEERSKCREGETLNKKTQKCEKNKTPEPPPPIVVVEPPRVISFELDLNVFNEAKQESAATLSIQHKNLLSDKLDGLWSMPERILSHGEKCQPFFSFDATEYSYRSVLVCESDLALRSQVDMGLVVSVKSTSQVNAKDPDAGTEVLVKTYMSSCHNEVLSSAQTGDYAVPLKSVLVKASGGSFNINGGSLVVANANRSNTFARATFVGINFNLCDDINHPNSTESNLKARRACEIITRSPDQLHLTKDVVCVDASSAKHSQVKYVK